MTIRLRVSMLIACTACVGAIHCVADEPKIGAAADGDGGMTDSGGALDDAAPSTIDVDGTLVLPSGSDSVPSTTPLPNRPVVIIDSNAVVSKVTSGSDGKFHVAGVKTPYDAFIPFDAPDAGTAVSPIFVGGLTRHDPTLFGYPLARATRHSASIQFTANVPNGTYLWVSAGGSSAKEIGTGASHDYSDFQFAWYGSSPTATASIGFLAEDGSGTFTGFELLVEQTFTDGAQISATPALALLGANKSVTVTGNPPGGYTFGGSGARFTTADKTVIGSSVGLTATSDLNIPPLALTQVSIKSDAAGAGNASSSASVTYSDYTAVPPTLSLSIPAAQIPLTPANNATGVKSTDALTWTASKEGEGYQLLINDDDGALLLVFTNQPELELTRLKAAGFTFTSGKTYTWYVVTTSGGTSDDFAQPGGTPPKAFGVPSYQTTSAPMKFTMQ